MNCDEKEYHLYIMSAASDCGQARTEHYKVFIRYLSNTVLETV